MADIDLDLEINALNRNFKKSFESDLFDSYVCRYLAIELFNYPNIYDENNPTKENIIDYQLIDELYIEILSYALKNRHDNKDYFTALTHYAKAQDNFILENQTIVNQIRRHAKNQILNKLIEYFLLSCFAQVSYMDKNFHISTLFISQRERVVSRLLIANNLDDDLIKKAISELNTKIATQASDARWGDSVEQQRKRYLELFEQKKAELGKKPTIKDVANWISIYHNEFDVEYETIRDHLSKALKGNFTNK